MPRAVVFCALVVLTAVIAPMAVLAFEPLADSEIMISNRLYNRWDKWNYTTGATTELHYVQPGADSYAAAWAATGWKVAGVDDGLADIFVTSPTLNRVYVINAQATALCDGNSIITDGVNYPMDLCVRGDHLYVLNDGNGTVTRYNKQTGVRDTSWNITGLPESSVGLAVTADGSVYVACGAFDDPLDSKPAALGVPGLQKYNASGAFVGTLAADVDGASNFFCVREDWDGNLWVTSSRRELDPETEEYHGVGYIYKINPTSGAVDTFWSSGHERLRQLAFTPDRSAVVVVSHDTSHWYRIRISDRQILNDVDTQPNWTLGGILSTFNRDEADLPEPAPVGTLSGTITLEDYSLANCPVAVGIDLIKGTGVTHHTVTLDGSGSYMVAGIVPGTYDVAFKAANWLKTVVAGKVISGNTSCNVTLKNGDVDGDNAVTSTDLSISIKNTN